MSAPITTMRIDEQTKRQARPILEELGLNISSATNLFLKAVVRNKGLPFALRLIEEPQGIGNDYLADFLAPVMSERNEIRRAGANATRLRERLAARRETIEQGRRTAP